MEKHDQRTPIEKSEKTAKPEPERARFSVIALSPVDMKAIICGGSPIT
jgi:hypothetical protein